MNKDKIFKDWFGSFLEAFPEDKSCFLKKNKDSFANPIGSIASVSLKNLLEELFGEFDEKKVKKELDAILRLLAIQEMKPSRALSFIPSLKRIIKEDLTLDVEMKIEKMFLMAFDVYMACREQIYKFKANHIKNSTLNILERKGLLCDVPEFGAEIISKDIYQSDAFQAELGGSR